MFLDIRSIPSSLHRLGRIIFRWDDLTTIRKSISMFDRCYGFLAARFYDNAHARRVSRNRLVVADYLPGRTLTWFGKLVARGRTRESVRQLRSIRHQLLDRVVIQALVQHKVFARVCSHAERLPEVKNSWRGSDTSAGSRRTYIASECQERFGSLARIESQDSPSRFSLLSRAVAPTGPVDGTMSSCTSLG